nr:exopolysaccharide biosynthesis polyprenyl glycosylphosphotransferase [Salsipaludibacter albus]
MVVPMVVSFGWNWPDYPMWQYAVSFTIIIATFVASFYFGGLYEREPRLGRPPVMPWAFRQSLAAGALIALANLVVTGALELFGTDTPRALPIPTTRLIVLIVGSPIAVAFVRWAAARHRTRREGPPRVMLLGTEREIEVARRHLDRAEATVVATATSVADLAHLVDVSDTTNLVLLSADWAASLYPDVVDQLERRNVSVLQRVTAAETLYGLQRVRQVGGLPFVLLRPHVMPGSRARLKRLTDVVLLALGAVAWVPLMALVALYQLAVAGRPLLFWQVRVGAGGEPFRMVKFRTMTVDAEEDGSPQLAAQNDPRIIPACAWVRATRMDELPQLFNILRGEMSLVGPRPERPELTQEFSDAIRGYARRHEVPPGLTGLAQIHGHYHTDPEYKLGYDLQYVANWSPMLDLEILVRTVWVVLARRI